MFLSVFDVFKIGIGPSSSHTMGPMSAANRFLELLLSDEWPRPSAAHVASLKVSLHGSLAYTGIGHGMGRAVILGLTGEEPQRVDPDRMDGIIAEVERTGRVMPPRHPAYEFRPAEDLVFDRKQPLPGHANGMTFSAFDADGRLLVKRIYDKENDTLVYLAHSRQIVEGSAKMAISTVPLYGEEVTWTKGKP